MGLPVSFMGEKETIMFIFRRSRTEYGSDGMQNQPSWFQRFHIKGLPRIVSIITLFAFVIGIGIFVAMPRQVSAQSTLARQFHTITTVSSTVPANGDVNPYGVAVVPRTVGHLVGGNVLVSNFNNGANLQGTGTTIVEIAPNGSQKLFAQITPQQLHGACPGGIGLTTALVVLSRGWVIVGSLPTADGTSATAQAGCLIVLDSNGNAVETFAGTPINGPWDMTAQDNGAFASLFVTNVLNGNVAHSSVVVNQGTVVRINLSVPESGYGLPHRNSTTVIGSGFAEKADPAALIIGPTGVGLDDRTLYVADSVNNRIAAIPDALTRTTSASTGRTVSQNGGLNDPLGLTIASNDNILTANGNDGNLIETTPHGVQVASVTLDTVTGAGALFGITLAPHNGGIYFVNDGDNTLKLFH